MKSPTQRLSPVLLALACFACFACGGGGEPANPTPDGSGADPEEAVAGGSGETLNPSARRSDDPRVLSLRKALSEGRLDQARLLARQIEGIAGAEGALLQARLAYLDSDQISATRLIEVARALAPEDPRVYATAAEMHADAGRLDTADNEIKRGVAECGPGPELLRARGIWLICKAGNARYGLKMLEEAQRADPELPFLDRPFGQAHLLVAKGFSQEDDFIKSLLHAQKSVHFDPQDLDARRFLAETLALVLKYGPAIKIYEQLMSEGEPLGGELARIYKRAGIAGLMRSTVDPSARDLAISYFIRASELGLTDDELASGAHILKDEARKCVLAGRALWDAGKDAEALEEVKRAFRFRPGFGQALAELEWYEAQVAFDAGDLVKAEEKVRGALDYDLEHIAARALLSSCHVSNALVLLRAGEPEKAIAKLRKALVVDGESLEAHNFLATALFDAGEFAEAISHWGWVCQAAREDGLELPDPIHLHLSRAYFMNEQYDLATFCLEGYLRDEPQGRWVKETRTLLESMGGAAGRSADGETSEAGQGAAEDQSGGDPQTAGDGGR